MKIGWKTDTVVWHKDTVGSPVSFLCQFLMQANTQNHQGSPLSERYFIVAVRFCYFVIRLLLSLLYILLRNILNVRLGFTALN